MPRYATEQQFWQYVDFDAPGGCWLWTGRINQHGYGEPCYCGRYRVAHRIAYELLVGPIPGGLQIDHLCRNRACVNPAHLEPVTQRENILRGEGPAAQNARRTRCRNGHEFTNRRCLICARESAAAYRARMREHLVANPPPPRERPCTGCGSPHVVSPFRVCGECRVKRKKAQAAAYYQRNREAILARLAAQRAS